MDVFLNALHGFHITTPKFYPLTHPSFSVSGALFGMLDTETDSRMRSDIHDTLNSMLQTLAAQNLTHWLGLCRDVLSASKSSKATKGPEVQKRDEEQG